tara:strand:- start:59034 stop:59966 length:933 start_codon:yes stop_codon:yes gene_type:complete
MSVQSTTRKTINLIRYFKDKAKAAIIHTTKATIGFIKRLPQNLGRYLAAFWSACKVGLSLGKELIKLPFRALRYILQNFGKCLKSLWRAFKWGLNIGKELIKLSFEIAKYVVLNFATVIKNVATIISEVTKFFYRFYKALFTAIYNNIAALAKWFFNNTLDIMSQVVGITLGIIIAPFEILFDITKPIFKGLYHAFAALCNNIADKASIAIGITLGLMIAPFEIGLEIIQDIFGKNTSANPAPIPEHSVREDNDVVSDVLSRSENTAIQFAHRHNSQDSSSQTAASNDSLNLDDDAMLYRESPSRRTFKN